MNVTALYWIFWLSLAFCAYTLVGYLICLLVLGLVCRRIRRREPIEPTVSILIAVRNAERVIRAKLQNCLALDYPKHKLEIIVACDGPSLATEEIVNSFANPHVRCISVSARGKSFALGAALEESSGEIIVFTDAAVRLDPHGIRAIVSNFADSKVGCVSSEDVTEGADGNAEPLYVSFDRWMRRLECRVRTLIGASGSFFAARREVCRAWDDEMTSDFFVPLRAIKAGFDVIVDPQARGYMVSADSGQEFPRKVRTLVNGIHVLCRHWQLMNPFTHTFVAWNLVSRKLFRWLLPFGLMALLISNSLLWSCGWFYRVAFLLQVALYGTGLLAILVRPLQQLLPFKIAGFFLMGNVATIKAWWKFAGGERYVSWQPTRRDVVGGQS